MELSKPEGYLSRLTLPRLDPAVGLVDHVDAALAAHQAIVAVARAQRFQRIPDLHGPDAFIHIRWKGRPWAILSRQKPQNPPFCNKELARARTRVAHRGSD